ncbi:MAG TPA: hypothetical protein VIK71_10560 [Flavobacteriales bacterium]|jgi:hypothetical protein
MNFLRRLFASKVKDGLATAEKRATPHPSSSNLYRFTSLPLTSEDKQKTVRIIESYLENQQLQVPTMPLCHPSNLDFLLHQGTGFVEFYRNKGMTHEQVIEQLANAVSIYLLDHCGYKRYEDSNPESPKKTITLKSVKGESVASIYPIEYCNAVLNKETTFAQLLTKI